MQRLFRPLVYLVIPAAAFITFLLQPIIGKELMPRYGGSAGTWMTISLFFQTALLAGYALAAWLLRQPRARLHGVMAALALAGPATLKLPPWNLGGVGEWLAVLSSLTLSLLPTLLLTTSVGIVVQGWIRERRGSVPYFLYGISNLGSLLALLAYPFLIEPAVGLNLQANGLRLLLILLSAAVLSLVVLERARGSEGRLAEDSEPEILPLGRVFRWVGLGFLTCTLMLGAVRILSAEIGSNPLSWLVPLGVYLLSFVLCFSGWWRRGATLAALVGLGLSLFGYMWTKGIALSELGLWPRAWLVGILVCGTLAGHGHLYETRPLRRFSFFYLILAVAGALAGVAASVGWPAVFSRNYEFAGAAFVLLGVGVGAWLARPSWAERLAAGVLVLGPAAWPWYHQLATERTRTATHVTYLRNYYTTFVLSDAPGFLSLSNETTLHGLQRHDPGHRLVPTSYYTRGSAVGQVIASLQETRPSLRIGVIGLGVGTLAAYLRPGDEMVFWDINPLAVQIARERFSFLRESAGRVEVRLRDGRLGVRADPGRFDVLVVDAFSGDSIPTHLLTREAVADYMEKLGDGVLVFHLSNRYIDLNPVVAAQAAALGLQVRFVESHPNSVNNRADEPARTKYALVFAAARGAEVDGWISALTQRSDFDYHLVSLAPREYVPWTDDRHAIVDLLFR